MLNKMTTFTSISLSTALQNYIFTHHQYSVISYYEITVYLIFLYKNKEYDGQKIGKISSDLPTKLVIDNNIRKLVNIGVLIEINDTSVFKITGRAEPTAHQLICSANPFCYISYLSAIEWHNLTDRILHTLYITQADSKTHKNLLNKKTQSDLPFLIKYDENFEKELDTYEKNPSKLHESYIKKIESYNNIKNLLLVKSNIPKNILDKKVEIKTVRKFKNYLPQENSNGVRVTPIGRTFLDMLREPNLCGGFEHVFQVLEEFAKKYLPVIVKTFEKEGTAIDKVRMGFILEEKLNIKHPIIEKWKKEAQRGGSRKLLAFKPYDGQNYSKVWQISINWGK